jgi:hypothetical protein
MTKAQRMSLYTVCTIDPADVARWNPNPREEKLFYDRLSAFHTKQGTQFNRYPVLGFRDLNLFRLSKTVEKLGGFATVCPPPIVTFHL